MTTEQLMQLTVPPEAAMHHVFTGAVMLCLYLVAIACSNALMNRIANDDEPPMIVSILWPISWPIIAVIVAYAMAEKLWRWVWKPRPWTCGVCSWRNPAENEACGCCSPGQAKTKIFNEGQRVYVSNSDRCGKIMGVNGAWFKISMDDGAYCERRHFELQSVDDYLKRNPVKFKVGDRVWHRGLKAFGTVAQNFLNGSEKFDTYTVDFRPGSASARSCVVSLARDLEDATLLCSPEEVEPYDPSKDELVDVLTSSPGGDETLVFAVLRRGQVVRYWEVDQSRWTVWADPASGKLKLVGGTIKIEWGNSSRPWALSLTPGWHVVSMEHSGNAVELTEEREERLTVQARFVLQRSKLAAAVAGHSVGTGAAGLRIGKTIERDPATNDIWRFDPFGGDSKTKIDDWCEPDAELAEPIKPRGMAYGSRPDPMAAPGTKQDVENLREAVRKLKRRQEKIEGTLRKLGYTT